MNAKIDIKTPAGKSLEGFPIEKEVPRIEMGEEGTFDISETEGIGKMIVDYCMVKLHPGDTITIEIL